MDAERHKPGMAEWLVVIGVCSHLGCVPNFWAKGIPGMALSLSRFGLRHRRPHPQRTGTEKPLPAALRFRARREGEDRLSQLGRRPISPDLVSRRDICWVLAPTVRLIEGSPYAPENGPDRRRGRGRSGCRVLAERGRLGDHHRRTSACTAEGRLCHRFLGPGVRSRRTHGPDAGHPGRRIPCAGTERGRRPRPAHCRVRDSRLRQTDRRPLCHPRAQRPVAGAAGRRRGPRHGRDIRGRKSPP